MISKEYAVDWSPDQGTQCSEEESETHAQSDNEEGGKAGGMDRWSVGCECCEGSGELVVVTHPISAGLNA